MDNRMVSRAADNIRILSAAMVEKAKSGHPGGAMGGADFINILYTEFLAYDPSDMCWPMRDRFFLDPGHMSPMIYSVLTLSGLFTAEELRQFRQWESPTPGHPERCIERGIENTSGPLGQGHAMAVGAAIAERFLAARFGEWTAHKTYSYISDGGVQEEISQGAGRIAGHLGLNNLIMFYDSNDIQLSHTTHEVTSEDTGRKYEAWGWSVVTINGNDPDQIRTALQKAHAEASRPTLIIGRTTMGKGAITEAGGSFESQVSTHGMPLSEAGASFRKTVEHLGGNPEDPFAVFPDVAQYYAKKRDEKIKAAAKRKQVQAQWEREHPDQAALLKRFLSGAIPEIDWKTIQCKPNCATRAASGIILSELAKRIDNMIVSSADLSNSDKTDGFLKHTKPIVRGDFSGKFLQIGVSELTMGALMNGIAAHGGVIAACGTFFVFSDYMKPAARLAALMGLPVRYVWTHDSFRVGEDGPTHQPVEHEAQLRLLEKMNNLEGRRSILVLRPADWAEAVLAWKMALENTTTPTALLFSRQNITDVPARTNSDRFTDAHDIAKGAYTVVETDGRPDLVLVANGSEVSTLVEVVKAWPVKEMKIRVVSAPSEALFREQSSQYQESVLPFGVPTFALTAGVPDGIAGLAGPLGKAAGLRRFGASAPYKVLDEKFGYNAQGVTTQVERYLEEYRATVRRLQALKA